MNTNQIGNLGELKVIETCLKNGIQVFTPFGDGNVVDLVIVVNGVCLKAQVKSTETGQDGVMTFKMKSEKSTRQSDTTHHYTENEIDVFLLYSFVYDEVYVLPIKEAPNSTFALRHDNPTKKLKTMHFAEDFLFEEKIFDLALQHSG